MIIALWTRECSRLTLMRKYGISSKLYCHLKSSFDVCRIVNLEDYQSFVFYQCIIVLKKYIMLDIVDVGVRV